MSSITWELTRNAVWGHIPDSLSQMLWDLGPRNLCLISTLGESHGSLMYRTTDSKEVIRSVISVQLWLFHNILIVPLMKDNWNIFHNDYFKSHVFPQISKPSMFLFLFADDLHLKKINKSHQILKFLPMYLEIFLYPYLLISFLSYIILVDI